MSKRQTYRLREAAKSARLVATGCISACVLPAAAQALAIPDPQEMEVELAISCPARPFEPAVSARPASPLELTKSAAILGGQSSALDRIRQQQTQLAPEPAAEVQLASVSQVPVSFANSCLAVTSQAPAPALAAAPVETASRLGEFLGTARVSIGITPFNDDWERVSSRALGQDRVARLMGERSQPGLETLASVNRWANRQVEYADDITTYGARDYWATAAETLRLGRGDCEDYAILKYQMLAALGFDRSRMYLTLARDLVRNADHAVLIVEVTGRHYLLDNATDVLLPANIGYDYRPTMSFNSESAWLHGYNRSPLRDYSRTQISYLSDNAVSSARVTGLSR